MKLYVEPVDFDPFANKDMPVRNANVALEPVDYNPFSKDKKPRRRIESDFSSGSKRSFNQLQATAFGATALAGSIMKKAGIDGFGQKVQDWGIKGYQRNMKEAKKYPKRYSFKDVYTGKAGIGGAIDWMQGVAGEAVPALAEAAIGAAIGTLVAPGAGSVAGGVAGRTILKKYIRKMTREMVEDQIQKGIIKESGRKILEVKLEKEATKQAMKKLGKMAAKGAVSLSMEAGRNYAELLDKKGIDAPGTALFFGALSTSLGYAGRGTGPVDVIVEGLGTSNGAMVKRAAKELLANVSTEALKKGGQETFRILNTIVNTDERFLTSENIEKIVESMGGASVGALGPLGVILIAKSDLTHKPADLLDGDKGGAGKAPDGGTSGPVNVDTPADKGISAGKIKPAFEPVDYNPFPNDEALREKHDIHGEVKEAARFLMSARPGR